MSTRCSIEYTDEWHLYTECFEESPDNLWVELREGEWEAGRHEATIKLPPALVEAIARHGAHVLASQHRLKTIYARVDDEGTVTAAATSQRGLDGKPGRLITLHESIGHLDAEALTALAKRQDGESFRHGWRKALENEAFREHVLTLKGSMRAARGREWALKEALEQIDDEGSKGVLQALIEENNTRIADLEEKMAAAARCPEETVSVGD